MPDVLSDAEYNRLAYRTLATIEAHVDRWLQDDVIDIDSSRSGGMLELTLPSGGKIIVNMQPPLQELWLAARAGGYHFKCVEGRWLDTRDGVEFFERLSACLTAQGSKSLTVKS
jgi:CyaY protein